jgi:basic membrane protein A
MLKKTLVVLGVMVLALGLAFNAGAAGKKLKVGLVYDVGGRGDQSFNDSAYRGLEWSASLGIEYVDIEPGADADRETGLRMMAEKGMDLVIGVGFLFTDAIKAVADEFPDTKFAIVDGFIPDKKNVSALLFKEHEGSFLVGVIAALRTKADGKKMVGFIGGMDIPLIHKFEAGYKAGVEWAYPGCEVLSDYAGTTPKAFADPVKGKELALAQVDKGAHVLYHASGLTGAGVYEAAKEKETYVIGVDSNQNHLGYVKETGKNYGLTSMLKQVDVAVYSTIKDLKDGKFKGGVKVHGLDHTVVLEGKTYHGVYFAMDKYNKDLVSKDMLAKVAEAEKKIIAGEIKVPEK